MAMIEWFRTSIDRCAATFSREGVAQRLITSSWSSTAFIEFLIRRDVSYANRLSSLSEWSEVKFCSARHLQEKLKKCRRNDVCHVVASGCSVLDSFEKIDVGRDSVYGFNFAAVCGVPFDLYFIEVASSTPGRVADLSDLQAELVLSLREEMVELLIAKNFYSGYLQPNFLQERYGPRLEIVKDIQLPINPLKYPDHVHARAVRALLRRRNFSLVQYGTTALTCIALAALVGFREIVVHGLDLSGSHFFSEGYFDLPESFLGRLRNYYPPVSADQKHLAGYKLVSLLPQLRHQLYQQGIILSVGSRQSPSAVFLPVYGES